MITENMDLKEIQKITGLTQEKEAKALLWFEFLVYNFDKEDFDVIAEIQIVEPSLNIKFIKDNAIVDIYFPKEKDNYYELAKFLDFYDELKQNEDLLITQRLTVCLEETPLEQYVFIDPIFIEKHGNNIGRPLNSFRFLYQDENIMCLELNLENNED